MIIYIYDFFTTRWNQQDFPFCFHSSGSVYSSREGERLAEWIQPAHVDDCCCRCGKQLGHGPPPPAFSPLWPFFRVDSIFFFFFFSFLLPTWFQFSFLFLFYSRRTPIFPKARLECYLYDCLCFSFLLSIIPSSCVLNGTEEKNKMIINPCVCVCCDWMLNLVVYIASKQPPFLFFFHLLLSTCTTVGRSYVIGEDYNSAGDAEITWIYYMLSEHL
jgi:hypothetical protein